MNDADLPKNVLEELANAVDEEMPKVFAKLMLEGKIDEATKLIASSMFKRKCDLDEVWDVRTKCIDILQGKRVADGFMGLVLAAGSVISHKSFNNISPEIMLKVFSYLVADSLSYSKSRNK